LLFIKCITLINTIFFTEMSSFPPRNWQVKFLEDMDSMEGTVLEGREVSLEALLAVRPSNGEEGTFRFVLAGCKHLNLRFEASSIIQDSSLNNMWLELQLEVGTQIKLEKNSVASRWSDMVELVSSQDVDVTNNEGEDNSEAFLAAMAAIKTKEGQESKGKQTIK